MKFISSHRNFIAFFFTLLIIFEVAAYVATTPMHQENFFELYALGAKRLADDYYPNNSPRIQTGQAVTWYIGVSNRMGTVQFVDIRVKLGNVTFNPPNDTTVTPSPAPLIVEFKRVISNNGTWEIPFVWRILNFTTTRDGHSRIIQLQIGNVTYALQNSPTCPGLSSCRFRFIFELWTWSVNSGEFQLGWWNGGKQRIAWLQLWFNLTPGAP
jgi:uncharacterized membrane protein